MSDIYFSVTREFDGEFRNPTIMFENDDVHRSLERLVQTYFCDFTRPIHTPKKMRLIVRLETVKEEEQSDD